MEIFTVAFFGHREVAGYFTIERRLEEEIRSLMNGHEYVDFLVGRNGEFDQTVRYAKTQDKIVINLADCE